MQEEAGGELAKITLGGSNLMFWRLVAPIAPKRATLEKAWRWQEEAAGQLAKSAQGRVGSLLPLGGQSCPKSSGPSETYCAGARSVALTPTTFRRPGRTTEGEVLWPCPPCQRQQGRVGGSLGGVPYTSLSSYCHETPAPQVAAE